MLVLTIIFCCACGSETNGAAKEVDLAELVTVVGEYSYENSNGYTYHALIVKNNSNKAVNVDANIIAKDASGNALGANTSSADTVASGAEALLYTMFPDVKGAAAFEYTLTIEEEKMFEAVTQDLSVEQSINGEKVIVMCTNNGKETAENIVAQAIFLEDGKFVDYDINYFTEDIKAGATIAGELTSRKTFDEAKVYISGWR